jgi:hypothetical protein
MSLPPALSWPTPLQLIAEGKLDKHGRPNENTPAEYLRALPDLQQQPGASTPAPAAKPAAEAETPATANGGEESTKKKKKEKKRERSPGGYLGGSRGRCMLARQLERAQPHWVCQALALQR